LHLFIDIVTMNIDIYNKTLSVNLNVLDSIGGPITAHFERISDWREVDREVSGAVDETCRLDIKIPLQIFLKNYIMI